MYIDVGNGLSINAKHIESVESLDSMNSIVRTTGNMFEIPMPRELVMSMIERGEGTSRMSSTEKLLTEIYSKQVTPRP